MQIASWMVHEGTHALDEIYDVRVLDREVKAFTEKALFEQAMGMGGNKYTAKAREHPFFPGRKNGWG